MRAWSVRKKIDPRDQILRGDPQQILVTPVAAVRVWVSITLAFQAGNCDFKIDKSSLVGLTFKFGVIQKNMIPTHKDNV